MAVVEFTLGVGSALQGRPSQIINDFSAWTLNNNLDEGCSLSFSSRGQSLGAALIQELETDVYIYKNGVLFQRFRITNLTQRWNSDGEDIIDVSAICYRRLLKSRHVITPLAFSGVGHGDIIWALIDHTQSQPSGDLGITIGSLDNSVLRDRSYITGDNIFDAITDFTRVSDGIAWDITPNLELVVRPLFDYPLRRTPIELGATARSMQRPSNAENFANVSIVSGDGEATTPVVLGTPGLVFDPRGRWEKIAALPGEQFQSALSERAFGTLDTALSPPSTWTVDMVPFRFFTDLDLEIGQLVALVEPPTIAYRRGPADAVLLQIVDRTVAQTSDGDFDISVSGVEITPPNPILTLAQARLSALGAVPNQKAAGGEVTTDGQFVYHTFTTSEAFIPLPEFGTLQIEYLLVGGGGGGGGGIGSGPGGGGGGGEIVTNAGSPVPINSAEFVSIGAGGPQNLNGSPTSFLTATAVGGGAGANSTAAAQVGASGGGGTPVGNPAGAAGTAGNSGGSYIGTSGEAGGAGGGGAGTAGSDVDDIVSINKIGGVGGDGAVDTFTGAPIARAGGGGGGYYFDTTGIIVQPVLRIGAAGGTGGGGRGGGASGGAETRNGFDGVAGTGGGGGGGSIEFDFFGNPSAVGVGGDGGSGLAIIRYLA
jgi:hypothetical protein